MPPRTRKTATAVLDRPTPDTAGDAPVEVVQIPVTDIAPHPRNVRIDLGDLTELIASIAQRGVRTPLTVMANPRAGQERIDGDPEPTWMVVAGHRRLAAAQAAALTTVPCLVTTDLTTEADVTLEMLTENLHRASLSPIEEATAYAQLELAGMKPTEIAKRVGRSRTTVEQRVKLLDLPEQVRERVHTHQVTLEEAAVLLEFAGDAKAVARLEDAIGTPNWSYQVTSERRRVEDAQRLRDVRKRLTGRGVRLVDKLPIEHRAIGSDSRHPELARLSTLGFEAVWAPGAEDLGARPWSSSPDLDWPDHAACPGHGVHLRSFQGAVWLCTDAVAQHPDRVTPTAAAAAAQNDDDPEQAAERERAAREAREQAEQWQQALTTARQVRLDWIRTHLGNAGKGLPKGWQSTLAGHVAAALWNGDTLEHIDSHDLVDVLAVEVDDDEDPYDTAETVLKSLRERDGALPLLAITAAFAEDESANPIVWALGRYGADSRHAWFTLLQALGYPMSDVDKDLAARVAPARPVEDVPTGDVL